MFYFYAPTWSTRCLLSTWVYCIVRGQQMSSWDLIIAESVSEIKLSSFELLMMPSGLVKLNRIYNLHLLFFLFTLSLSSRPPTRYARWLIIPNIDYEKNIPDYKWVRKKELVIISKRERWWKRSCNLSIVYLTHSWLDAHLF